MTVGKLKDICFEGVAMSPFLVVVVAAIILAVTPNKVNRTLLSGEEYSKFQYYTELVDDGYTLYTDDGKKCTGVIPPEKISSISGFGVNHETKEIHMIEFRGE